MKLSKIVKLEKTRSVLDNNCLIKDNYVYSADYNTVIMTKTTSMTDNGIYLKDKIDFLVKSNVSIFDFPIMDMFTIDDNINSLSISKDELSTLLDTSSKDETRPFLNGIYLDNNNNTIVSTDGFKMVTLSREFKFTDNKDGYIVPRQSIKKALSLMGKKDSVKFYMSTNKDYILINHNDWTIASKIINREFPNYKMIMFKEDKLDYTIFKNTLNIKEIKPLLNKNNIVSIFETNGKVMMNIENTDYTKEIGIANQNTDFIFKCNVIYLDSVLRDGNNYMTLNGKLRPIKVRNGNFENYIMPCK